MILINLVKLNSSSGQFYMSIKSTWHLLFISDYSIIIIQLNHLPKFVQIHPLRTKTAVEVSNVLLDIFRRFGAPSILQSDNGRDFAKSVIAELCSKWLALKMVHGKPRHSQSQGSAERANQDIQSILMTRMSDEKSSKWLEGLKFVQLKKIQPITTVSRKHPTKRFLELK